MATASAKSFLLGFQIKESPEGDWNTKTTYTALINNGAFKLKNPRKGTETHLLQWIYIEDDAAFKLKNPRKGTETKYRHHPPNLTQKLSN